MTATTTIVGNLTRDPELRYTASGRAWTRLGVASNRRWRNRTSGDWEEATSFFNVTCWGDLAERVADSLSKGDRVIVFGRLEQRTYEDRDGTSRNVVDVIADEIGPSLRWAVARPERVARSGAGGGNGSGSGGGDWEPEPAGDGGFDEPF